MEQIMKRFADIVIKHRLAVLLIIGLITCWFAYEARRLTISTNFNELLPQDHPYIKIHNDFRKTFGGANFLVIMVSVDKGDIFNTATLEKIRFITNELETVPGVDRYKILSIASRKIKNPRITSWGIEATPLMWPEVPKDEAGMNALRDAIYSNEAYYGSYVSFDSKKALIFADFFEEELDYSLIYRELQRIRAVTEDENTTVSIVGHPMHLGVVASYIRQMNYIMAGTGIVIPILLFIAYRSLMATVFVPLAAVISGIWGLGFYALMGYNLDPLIFVMPFLISLMAFRHSHQLYNRYFEEYIKTGDPLSGVRVIIEQMFLPGLTSIITDAFGIAVVAITPVPTLQHMGIAGAFWSFITVIIGLILTPILMTYVPVSPSFLAHIQRERLKDERREGFANKFADWLGPWLIGRGRYWVLAWVLVITVGSYIWAEKLIIGDAQVGSNLLYPSSRYNQDSVRINQNMPLINPLYIVLEGEKVRSLTNLEVMQDIKNFSTYMMQHSGGVGAQTIIGPLMAMPQKFHEDDPKWMGLPEDPAAANAYLIGLTQSGDPGDMNKFLDPKLRQTNIVVFYMDKTGPTIERAIATAKKYIAEHSKLPEGFQYKLAGGVIGTEAAINEMVASKQLQTLLLALLGVFLFCTLEFRSIKAGLILTIPLLISNYMAFAYMAINEIGLSISTLPVSAAGIGMGVDYGIYLMARCFEEKKREVGITLETALMRTIQSYSKSIIYIAGTLVLGLLVWALSGLKFQAQMGVMLAVILFFNCLGAVFVVPVLMLLFRPKFLVR
ncbi:MAG: MMPL family transporter [Desulfobacterota bacterium]|nr:MMPL family transporter [Thermodesulfobacteriota bacterium]